MRNVMRMLLCAMVLCGLSTALAVAAASLGKAAPDFSLKDHAGNTVKLSDLKGKVVVLEWFNAHCPVTLRHHSDKSPTMRSLAEKYKARGVVWLAICSNSSGSIEDNAASAKELKVPYQILNDSTTQTAKAYGARATPHMFIVDAHGNLAYNGAIDDDPSGSKPAATNYIAKALEELLEGKSVTTPQTKPYGCGVKYAD